MAWNENWTVFGTNGDGSHDRIYDALFAEGVVPKEFLIYGSLRTIVQSMGLNGATSHIFHGPNYVGTEADLSTYIYTQKRLHGEI